MRAEARQDRAKGRGYAIIELTGIALPADPSAVQVFLTGSDGRDLGPNGWEVAGRVPIAVEGIEPCEGGIQLLVGPAVVNEMENQVYRLEVRHGATSETTGLAWRGISASQRVRGTGGMQAAKSPTAAPIQRAAVGGLAAATTLGATAAAVAATPDLPVTAANTPHSPKLSAAEEVSVADGGDESVAAVSVPSAQGVDDPDTGGEPPSEVIATDPTAPDTVLATGAGGAVTGVARGVAATEVSAKRGAMPLIIALAVILLAAVAGGAWYVIHQQAEVAQREAAVKEEEAQRKAAEVEAAMRAELAKKQAAEVDAAKQGELGRLQAEREAQRRALVQAEEARRQAELARQQAQQQAAEARRQAEQARLQAKAQEAARQQQAAALPAPAPPPVQTAVNPMAARQSAQRRPYRPAEARCDISADTLAGRNFQGCLLAAADLHGVSLAGANLEGANLSSADLTGANLNGAKLTGANLTGAKLGHARLNNAAMTNAKLTAAKLVGADLSGALLRGANLRDVDASGVTWTGASLTGAVLHSARFDCAALRGAADYKDTERDTAACP